MNDANGAECVHGVCSEPTQRWIASQLCTYTGVFVGAMRRSGGSDLGATFLGGNSANNSVVAVVMMATARSKAASVESDSFCTPLTFRTNWRAAASISSAVAMGSSPRNVVMFRHMPSTVGHVPEGQGAVTSSNSPTTSSTASSTRTRERLRQADVGQLGRGGETLHGHVVVG